MRKNDNINQIPNQPPEELVNRTLELMNKRLMETKKKTTPSISWMQATMQIGSFAVAAAVICLFIFNQKPTTDFVYNPSNPSDSSFEAQQSGDGFSPAASGGTDSGAFDSVQASFEPMDAPVLTGTPSPTSTALPMPTGTSDPIYTPLPADAFSTVGTAASTETALPTWTATSTGTPLPTVTPAPTMAPTPTATSTPTVTPVATEAAPNMQQLAATISINDAKFPRFLQVGHRFALEGIINAEDAEITRIKANVSDKNGATKFERSVSPNSSSFDLSESSVIQQIQFQALKTGAYVYKVTVTAENDEEESTVTVIDEEFWVVDEDMDMLKGQPLDIRIENAWSPTLISKDVMFMLKGSISTTGILTDVTATIYTSTGNAVMVSSDSPCEQKYYLGRSKVDSGISFGELPAGNYVYELTATSTDGVDFHAQTLISQTFEVASTGKDSYGTDAVIE